MTFMLMYKKCPVCKRKYSWNPDVGKMFCPYCSSFSEMGAPKSAGKRREENAKNKNAKD